MSSQFSLSIGTDAYGKTTLEVTPFFDKVSGINLIKVKIFAPASMGKRPFIAETYLTTEEAKKFRDVMGSTGTQNPYMYFHCNKDNRDSVEVQKGFYSEHSNRMINGLELIICNPPNNGNLRPTKARTVLNYGTCNAFHDFVNRWLDYLHENDSNQTKSEENISELNEIILENSAVITSLKAENDELKDRLQSIAEKMVKKTRKKVSNEENT